MNSEPMFKMNFHALSMRLAVALLAGATFTSASAQLDTTPRERLLNYLQQQNTSLDAAPLTANSAAATEITDSLETPAAQDGLSGQAKFADGGIGNEDIQPEVITTSPSAVVPDIIASEPDSSEIIATSPDNVLTQAERENSIVRDFTNVSRPSTELSLATTGPESFGFFISARDYLAQRGQAQKPRLTLRYDVTRKNAKTAVPGNSSTVDIIIGTDYAAISKSSDKMVIYDFKEKRLLTISLLENTFSNASLYAAAYRSLDAVGKMTAGGTSRTIALGDNVSLDAFFLESALGYAAGPTPQDLAVTLTGEKISANFAGEQVFSAMLDGPKLDDFRQAYSLIGLLYHSEPVHPAILAEFIDVRTAPSSMTFHSFGPKTPDGEIINWTLKSKMQETSVFPLPASAKSIIELESVSPLGYVMAEAVAGRAMGGRVDPTSALTVINQQLAAGDPLSAWVSAQSLKDSLGGCEQLIGLCKAISNAESQKESITELNALITALSQTQRKTTRAQGVSALKPMISAPDAPSLVLRRAGLALAKMSKAEREAAGLTDLDAAELLSQAIARNPYDFLAYQGLAQLQAARGDFILSWDINDALRAFSDVPERLRGPIDRAESQLATRAPGFFPPVGG